MSTINPSRDVRRQIALGKIADSAKLTAEINDLTAIELADIFAELAESFRRESPREIRFRVPFTGAGSS